MRPSRQPGLTADATANPYDLGYSRRKLLALASILAMQTPVVVLDEPTTGQDARGVARVQAIVRDLSAAGRTVIAISHDMRFVAETFERVVVMRAGKVVLDDDPAVVFAEDAWATLSSTFLEPPLAARVGARLGLGATPTEGALVVALAGEGRWSVTVFVYALGAALVLAAVIAGAPRATLAQIVDRGDGRGDDRRGRVAQPTSLAPAHAGGDPRGPIGRGVGPDRCAARRRRRADRPARTPRLRGGRRDRHDDRHPSRRSGPG